MFDRSLDLDTNGFAKPFHALSQALESIAKSNRIRGNAKSKRRPFF